MYVQEDRKQTLPKKSPRSMKSVGRESVSFKILSMSQCDKREESTIQQCKIEEFISKARFLGR